MTLEQIRAKISRDCSWLDMETMIDFDIGYWAYEIRLARFQGLPVSFYLGWDYNMTEHKRTLEESVP